MQTAKLKILSAFLGVLALTFVSCDNDEHSSDNYQMQVLTVVPTGSNTYILRADDGTTMMPTPNTMTDLRSSRAKVQYTVLKDSVPGYDMSVRVNYLDYILTKSVINLNAANADSIGYNKVHVIDMWEGDNYLNIQFQYYMGGYGVSHLINLVRNQTLIPPNDGKIHLEFRHNAKGDVPRYTAFGLVSFDLTPFKVAGADSVTFVIKVNDFDSEREYTVPYKYVNPTPLAHQFPSNLTLNTEYK